MEELLRTIADGDLHVADPGIGWTGATVVSHLTLAGLLWVADVARLQADPDLDLHHRDQLHDVQRSRGTLPARFDLTTGGAA